MLVANMFIDWTRYASGTACDELVAASGRARPDTPSGTEPHAFIDGLQVEFGAVRAAVVEIWFASFSWPG